MSSAHSKVGPCRVCKRPITFRQGYLQVKGEEPRHYDCQRARIRTLEDLFQRILLMLPSSYEATFA